MPAEDLEWALALQRARKRRSRYKLARDYYEGAHRLLFAKERFTTVFGRRFSEIADNLCPAVVDSIADRLKVTGFSSSATRRRETTIDGKPRTVVSDPLAAQAWAIWRRNRMGQRAAEVHRESLLTGDGYAMVWPDESGAAAIWPQIADEMVVEYSETTPGVIERAARLWVTHDKTLRVNIYFPDRIEKYVSDRTRSPLQTSFKHLVPLGGDEIVENPYGRVPVFHFPNRRLFTEGVSELRDVIPIQDALNKAVCDMLVAMEFSAFRQRWVVGVDLDDEDDDEDDDGEGENDIEAKPPPFKPGIDRIFALSSEKARFGEFSETNLEQFLKVQEDLRGEIARVSGTPLHLFFLSRGDYPSGEAMKSAESRFTEKLEDQQESKGNTWEDALTFALAIEQARLPRGFELDALWKDAQPRSEEERARTASIKVAAGVSRRQGLRELGYDDATIEEMLDDEPEPSIERKP